MTESNQDEIINRLHKLEKQNRYMKLGGLAILLPVVTTTKNRNEKNFII